MGQVHCGISEFVLMYQLENSEGHALISVIGGSSVRSDNAICLILSTGCEYGDRFSDCSGRDCSMTYYQRHCCYTCRREAARPTYPPSTLPASTTTDAEETGEHGPDGAVLEAD